MAGLGTGAAAVGLRPIVEMMFFDFAMLAIDQIVNQAAKYRYFTGGSLPLAIRTCAAPADRTAPSTRRTSRPGSARSPG